jgi:hypothetical protein
MGRILTKNKILNSTILLLLLRILLNENNLYIYNCISTCFLDLYNIDKLRDIKP